MLKLTASYGKKLPVEGLEFSSISYHASVEVEIPEGLNREELDGRIRDTFDLVRDSVETELASDMRTNELPAGQPAARRFRAKPQRKAKAASEKQLSYLRDIATRKGITQAELEGEAAAQFGVDSLELLAREDASHLIDSLGGTPRSRQRREAA